MFDACSRPDVWRWRADSPAEAAARMGRFGGLLSMAFQRHGWPLPLRESQDLIAHTPIT
jgi:hypothetical protein